MFKYTTLLFTILSMQTIAAQTFKVIPLGVHGGMEESNLSAYLVAENKSEKYICMDAGTLYSGAKIAIKNHVFTGLPEDVIRKNIAAYFISHPHLDHLAGLIQNAPTDTKKTIYGLPFCISAIEKHYFSWDTWANFSDRGEKPQLNKYHLAEMQPDSVITVANTGLSVQAFELSHGTPFKSTAFLVRDIQENCLLYLGDTGSDTIEHADNLKKLWTYISPLIQSQKLKGIFIEVSFPNNQPNNLLFGHLTPSLLNRELLKLGNICGKELLKSFPIVITHIKPEGNNEAQIRAELRKMNPLNVQLIFPEQGKTLQF